MSGEWNLRGLESRYNILCFHALGLHVSVSMDECSTKTNHLIARSKFKVHLQFIRSKCNEHCDPLVTFLSLPIV